VITGDQIGSSGKSGYLNLKTGNSDGQDSGDITIETGNSAGETGDVSLYTGDSSGDNSGAISILTGGGNLTSGAVSITSGDPFIDTGSTSGGVTIKTGGTASTVNAGHSGNLIVKTGQGGTDESGTLNLTTGETSTGNSGLVNIFSGQTTTGNSGTTYLMSGPTQSSGDSGLVQIASGNSASGDSGLVTIFSGDAPGGDSGDISISTGAGSTKGEVKVASNSIATGGLERKLVQIASDGILKTLGINILGYGTIELRDILKDSEIYRVPIFFGNNTTSSVEVDPNNWHGSQAGYTPNIVETYSGDAIFDAGGTEDYIYTTKVMVFPRAGSPIRTLNDTSYNSPAPMTEEIFTVEQSFYFVASNQQVDVALNFCGHLAGKIKFTSVAPAAGGYDFFLDYVVYTTD
jgi:hypothetical protein